MLENFAFSFLCAPADLWSDAPLWLNFFHFLVILRYFLVRKFLCVYSVAGGQGDGIYFFQSPRQLKLGLFFEEKITTKAPSDLWSVCIRKKK
jgi:hypothetical protein